MERFAFAGDSARSRQVTMRQFPTLLPNENRHPTRRNIVTNETYISILSSAGQLKIAVSYPNVTSMLYIAFPGPHPKPLQK